MLAKWLHAWIGDVGHDSLVGIGEILRGQCYQYGLKTLRTFQKFLHVLGQFGKIPTVGYLRHF